MKKTFRGLIVLMLSLAILSPCAFAAAPSDAATNEQLVFTVTTKSYTQDENGQWILDEEITSSQTPTPLELVKSDILLPLTVLYKEDTVTRNLNGTNLIGKLSYKFEYEPGIYVRCFYANGWISKNTDNWTIKSQNSYYTNGPAETWARATYDVSMITTAGVGKAYSISVECSRGGNLINY